VALRAFRSAALGGGSWHRAGSELAKQHGAQRGMHAGSENVGPETEVQAWTQLCGYPWLRLCTASGLPLLDMELRWCAANFL